MREALSSFTRSSLYVIPLMKLRPAAFAPLIFLFFQVLPAFSQKYIYDHYSTKDGLSHSAVNSIAQDQNGYLWLATNSGISSFNGKTFRNFGVADGLANPTAWKLFIDSKGTLWIGHYNGEITRYHDGVFSKLKIKGDPVGSVIMQIEEDSRHFIWILTYTSGALRINPDKIVSDSLAEFDQYMGKEGLSDVVKAMFELNEKQLFFLTDVGSVVFDVETGRFEKREFPDVIPAARAITAVYSKPNIWIGTYEAGLFMHNTETNKVRHYEDELIIPYPSIYALGTSPSGKVFGGT